MALRNIVQEGDPVLGMKSREVTEISQRILTILDDMKETMFHAEGVGLAAPQVGILKRMAVVSVDRQNVYELINPVIIEQEGDQYGEEGCLSVPGYQGFVHRPMKVRVRCLNRQGDQVIYEAEGFLARAFCHEIDHLDGILYTSKAENMHLLPEEE